ncbi:MAG TPA: hypothetical protein VGQ83_38770 [Polyangia bacterium]|jgi:preprotein translocase subunit SecD
MMLRSRSLDAALPPRLAALLALAAASLAACSLLKRPPDFSRGGLELVYTVEATPQTAGREEALAQAAAGTIGRRIAAVGCRGEVRAAGREVRVRLPAACGPKMADLTRVIGVGGRLEFREVDAGDPLAAITDRAPPEAGVALDTQEWRTESGLIRHTRTLKGTVAALERFRAGLAPSALPPDVEPLIEAPPRPGEPVRLYLIKREVGLTGAAVQDAEVIMDPQMGRPDVSVTFDQAGAEAFRALTRRLVDQKLAIVLDGRVTSAPLVKTEIPGGRARITLGSAQDPAVLQADARALVVTLRSGALPSGLVLTREAIIQPSR